MPTYDYKCEACGTTFEKFQSMSAPPIKQCPSCKKSRVKRLIGTGAGLIFKGSGFYITDYRDAGYKEAAKKEGGSGTTSGGESKSGGEGSAANTSGGEAASKPAAESKPVAPAKPEPKPASPPSKAKKK